MPILVPNGLLTTWDTEDLVDRELSGFGQQNVIDLVANNGEPSSHMYLDLNRSIFETDTSVLNS